MSEVKKGWGWPALAKKPHYFYNARSICGRWLYTGDLMANTGALAGLCCAECRKRLAKQAPATAGGAT